MKKEIIYRNLIYVLEIILFVGFLAFIVFMLLYYAGYQNRTAGTMGGSLAEQESGEMSAKGGRESQSPLELFKLDEDPVIRVRLRNSDYTSEYHDCAVLCPEGQEAVTITEEELQTGEARCIEAGFGKKIRVDSLRRGGKAPAYSGKLYILKKEEGLMLINEVLLEEYLYGVISSEMPSDYPLEAQKAQAVCARTYAYNCISARIASGKTITDGDLDDSVSFQVYNNYSAGERGREAVDATKGEILPLDQIQYYSTDCRGQTEEDLSSEKAFQIFLDRSPEKDAEYGSPWLRWKSSLSKQSVWNNLCRYAPEFTQKISGEELSLEIQPDTRKKDGQLQSIVIKCEEISDVIEGEYEIRRILGSADAKYTLMDGSVVSGMQLLPSAWFFIKEAPGDCLEISGGGYGHGRGMSQCGAAAMASEGSDYKEILEYYYGGDTDR